jgi:hypothetical protein
LAAGAADNRNRFVGSDSGSYKGTGCNQPGAADALSTVDRHILAIVERSRRFACSANRGQTSTTFRAR